MRELKEEVHEEIMYEYDDAYIEIHFNNGILSKILVDIADKNNWCYITVDMKGYDMSHVTQTINTVLDLIQNYIGSHKPIRISTYRETRHIEKTIEQYRGDGK